MHSIELKTFITLMLLQILFWNDKNKIFLIFLNCSKLKLWVKFISHSLGTSWKPSQTLSDAKFNYVQNLNSPSFRAHFFNHILQLVSKSLNNTINKCQKGGRGETERNLKIWRERERDRLIEIKVNYTPVIVMAGQQTDN